MNTNETNASALPPAPVTASHTEAAAEGGNMGALLFKPDPGMAIWTWVVFFTLLLILWRFGWKPILNVLEDREKFIAKSLEQANEARQAALDLNENRAKVLETARKEAVEMVTRAKNDALQIAAEIESKAREEARHFSESAKAEIEREKKAALRELRVETGKLALLIAERALEEHMNGDVQKRLIEKHLDEVLTLREKV